MKLKHKLFKKCTVVMDGETFEISNGILEVTKAVGTKLLKKNKNLEEIVEETAKEGTEAETEGK